MPHLLRTAAGFRSRHPRTVFRLGVVALTVWIAATAVGWLQAVGDVPAPAAVFLALIAATLTVWAVEIAKRERERITRIRERAAFQAEVVAAAARRERTYVSSHALLDCNPITMELPRQRRPTAEPAMAASGGHPVPPARSQDYWDVFVDVTRTIFEQRDDDPEADA